MNEPGLNELTPSIAACAKQPSEPPAARPTTVAMATCCCCGCPSTCCAQLRLRLVGLGLDRHSKSGVADSKSVTVDSAFRNMAADWSTGAAGSCCSQDGYTALSQQTNTGVVPQDGHCIHTLHHNNTSTDTLPSPTFLRSQCCAAIRGTAYTCRTDGATCCYIFVRLASWMLQMVKSDNENTPS
jgi:hypothetical protein